MRTIEKVKLSNVYMVSSEDDQMYIVKDYGDVIARIVETIDGTRQTLYFPDGSEMHFENTGLHDVMEHAPSKTDFQMAWKWFEDNGYVVRADEGNGFLEVEVMNVDGTASTWIGMSERDIQWKAILWRENKLK
jgi:hypothetical protein